MNSICSKYSPSACPSPKVEDDKQEHVTGTDGQGGVRRGSKSTGPDLPKDKAKDKEKDKEKEKGGAVLQALLVQCLLALKPPSQGSGSSSLRDALDFVHAAIQQHTALGPAPPGGPPGPPFGRGVVADDLFFRVFAGKSRKHRRRASNPNLTAMVNVSAENLHDLTAPAGTNPNLA